MNSAAARDTRAESSANTLTADVAAADKMSVRRVPRHQGVRTSPACILTWVRKGWSGSRSLCLGQCLRRISENGKR